MTRITFLNRLKKNGLFFHSKRAEHGLPAHLERLEYKGYAENMQRRNCLFNQICIITEDSREKVRESFYAKPSGKSIQERTGRHYPDGLTHNVQVPGSVVITDKGRRTIGNRQGRDIQNLPYRGCNGHNGNIQGSSKMRKHLIRRYEHHTIGSLHNKWHCPQRNNIPLYKEGTHPGCFFLTRTMGTHYPVNGKSAMNTQQIKTVKSP